MVVVHLSQFPASGYVTRSMSPPKSFHIHPQRFRQRVILTDGSQIELDVLGKKGHVITLIQDSIIHPSWNATKLKHQQLLLDSFGSISKFHKKYTPNNPDSSPHGPESSDVWKSLEVAFSAIEGKPTSTKLNRLEQEALKDPGEKKKPTGPASSEKKKSGKKF